MLTDLQPHQQCATIVTRLGGSTPEMARMITPQEIPCGGFRDGVQLDLESYMLAAFQGRLTALDEEARLASITEILAFSRRPGETMNASLALARYEIACQRAPSKASHS
jgi:hypothetical protein